MVSKTVLAGVLIAVSVMMAGCGGPTTPVDTGKKVDMKNSAYMPGSLTVAKGEKVSWTNQDSVGHTVTSDDASGPLKSATLQKAQKYEYTFTTPGVFKYHCAVMGHAVQGADGNWTGMVGTITVTA